MRGPGAGFAPLRDAQRKQVSAVQGKYTPRLDALQQKLNAMYSELATARANDNTTVAQLKALQGRIFQLQTQYRTLLGQANSEIAQVPGVGTASYIPCALGYGGRLPAAPLAAPGAASSRGGSAPVRAACQRRHAASVRRPALASS